MEVHHAHHPTHKKKWSEYLLEFFMLFLAVFLGFVAENIRESLVEKRREKEYVKSIIEDLKTDTAKITSILPWATKQVEGLDSLAGLFYQPVRSDSDIAYCYYYNRLWGNNIWPVYFTRRTINQLQNAGGMQLIRNQLASDSIVYYYDLVSEADGQMKTSHEYFQKMAQQTSYQVFFGNEYKGITRGSASKLLMMPGKLSFITNDPKLLLLYANELSSELAVFKNYAFMITNIQQQATRLIQLLQKEYHLENE